MNDPRRTLPPAPHGRAPNWLIVAIAGVVVVVSLTARAVLG